VSRADIPPSVLWRNRQTEACLVLRPKPRNCHSDFETQITTLVLRLNQETDHGFEVKPGEIVATSF
jgi:hypothetical protein